MSDRRSIIDELKRRKVVRTAAAYAVVGAGFIEVADIVRGALDLAPWILTAAVVLAVVGFPLVLTLEWVYEVTSEGVKRTSGSEGSGSADGGSLLFRPVAVGAVVVVVCGLGVWWLTSGGGQDGPEPIRVEGGVVLLPCDVQGEDISFMGEAMVVELSTRLDGTGLLRPIDRRSVMSFLDREGIDPTDPEGARGVADRFGADFNLQCSVFELEGNLRLEAALYRTAEEQPLVSRTVEGRVEDFFSLADQLALAILRGGPDPTTRLAGAAFRNTESLEALRRYVVGEEAYRAGRFAQAVSELQGAVAIDSAFALAHYRLSNAAGWAEQREVSNRALEAALAHADRLPPHDRTLVEAWVAYRGGEHERAKRLYEDVTREHPEDGEAWYQLGEVLFHGSWRLGGVLPEAADAFRRAVELDPDLNSALFHLFHLATLDAKVAELDSLAERLRRNDSDVMDFVDADLVLYGDREPAQDSLMQAIEDGALRTEPLAILTAELVPTLSLAERTARAFTGPGQTEANQVLGYLRTAGVRVAAGRWNEAREALTGAAELRPALTLEHRAHMALVAPPELVGGELRSLAERLESWDGTGDGDDGLLRTYEAPHADLHPWLRLYLLGMLQARLAEFDAALERSEALATAAAPEGLTEWLRDLATLIRAEVAKAEGDPGRALELLEGAPLWTVYRLDERLSPILGHFYPVFLRAELLRELGRAEEALAWYEALDYPFYLRTNALSTRILLGRAQALHALGRADEAEPFFAEVRERWSTADVELGVVPE